eukprot:15352300-Ditylum_brightwellii.AAC.1
MDCGTRVTRTRMSRITTRTWEWLAKLFQKKQEEEEAKDNTGVGDGKKVRLSIRAKNVGCGHMKYVPSKGSMYNVEEEMIPQTLLQMAKQTKKNEVNTMK